MGDRKSLEATIKKIKKEFGEGSLMWMAGEHPIKKVEVVPSGSLALDIALGAGGFPKGRIIEVFGNEACGKTSLCLHAINEVQKRGMTAAFIDTEHSLDAEYSRALGVNLENMLISQPDSGEQALEIAEQLIRGGDIGIVVVDSVAALTSKAELEGSIGDSHVGLQARLMSQAMRMLSGAIAKSNTMVVFTNQLRSKIATGRFGPTSTTSGGRALGYYASIRIKLWNHGKIEDGDNRVGGHITAEIVKNKIAPPYKKAELDIIYGRGIVRSHDLVNAGKQVDVITQSGSWFAFGEENIGHGMAKTTKAIEEDPVLADGIEDAIREKAGLPPRFIEDQKKEGKDE